MIHTYCKNFTLLCGVVEMYKSIEASYRCEKDVVFMLESGSYVTFFYLTNLPISPPSCYQQVVKIWNEFPSQYSEEYQNNHHL